MAGPLLKDALWARQSFITKSTDMAKVDRQNRVMSSANLRFTDTTPGGALCINPPPQYTRFADPKGQSPYSGSRNEGRFWVESIAENMQIVNMRFGVPKFNSLTSFFGGFYNSAAGQLAKTGRATSLTYDLGRAAGMIVGVIFWPLLVAGFVGQAINWALQKPSSKFYYLKPTMPQYWTAVQTMVNQIAVNRGIIPRIGGADTGPRFGGPYDFTPDMLKILNDKFPDIFNTQGLLDVYAVSTKAQRLATAKYKKQKAVKDSLQNQDIAKVIQQMEDDKSLKDPGASYDAYMKKWLATANSKPKGENAENKSSMESIDNSPAANTGFGDFLEAELNDGGAFVSFRVNYTGAQQESFSSSTTESPLAQKVNSMSGSARDTQFDFANGNIDDGLIGKAIGGVLGAAKDIVSGFADSLKISGLAMLTGAAFVDIPKHWASSSAQLPRMNYTVHLGGPYGNPISQLIDMYMPLCMLLAGALPISTGKQSYTSPFLVEIYDQGRAQTRLGIIDSMTVNRGTGNLGFNNEGNFMAVEVNFSVIDLSSLMHMPIAEGLNMTAVQTGVNVGSIAGPGGAAVGGAIGAGVDAAKAVGSTVAGFFDDETTFSDYLAVLGNMGLADQIYTYRRMKLQLTRSMTNLKSFFSAAHYASFVGDTIPARMISAIYKGTER